MVYLGLEVLKSPKSVCVFQTIRCARLFFHYVEIVNILSFKTLPQWEK